MASPPAHSRRSCCALPQRWHGDPAGPARCRARGSASSSPRSGRSRGPARFRSKSCWRWPGRRRQRPAPSTGAVAAGRGDRAHGALRRHPRAGCVIHPLGPDPRRGGRVARRRRRRSNGCVPGLVEARAGALCRCRRRSVRLRCPTPRRPPLLLGAAVAVGALGWPIGAARLGHAGATSATALLVWVVAVGGRGRPPSIIGGIACLGLLLAVPMGAVLRDRWPGGRQVSSGRSPGWPCTPSRCWSRHGAQGSSTSCPRRCCSRWSASPSPSRVRRC